MNDPILLRGGRVGGPGRVPEEAQVLIVGDRITDVGPLLKTDGRVFDATGMVLYPGLVDFHTHVTHFKGVESESPVTAALRAAKQARAMLRTGITAIRDTGSYRLLDLELRRSISDGHVDGPRMVCAAGFLSMSGGHGHPRGITVDGEDDVRKAARQQLHAGADFLKIMCSGGLLVPGTAHRVQFTESEIRAAAEEASAYGTVLAAHAHPAEAIRRAVKAGARRIEHGSFVDKETAALMSANDVVLTPTFAVYALTASGNPDPAMATAAAAILEDKIRGFHEALNAGVRWAVGSDSGTLTPASSFIDEIEFLHLNIGLSVEEVLRQATAGNADLAGFEDTGRVEAGARADLIGLSGDPADDLSHLRDVKFTIAGGRVYDWRHASWR